MNQYSGFRSNLHKDSKHAPKTYQKWKVLYAKQTTPNKNSSWIKG